MDNDFVVYFFGNGFFIVKVVYNVLFIDYRFMCGFLFLEYFLELMEVYIDWCVSELVDFEVNEVLM